MTRRTWMVGALALGACGVRAGAPPAPVLHVGDVAPDFELLDLQGAPYHLADDLGKTVVLEWFDPRCPYVVDAHTEGGALHGVAARRAAQGVVWLAIDSSGQAPTAIAAASTSWELPHPILLDPEGSVAKAYGVRSTPQVYVIDPTGVVRYQGAVDNQPMRQATGDRMPYLEQAVTDVVAGKPARTPRTRPYGCPVEAGG